jgi:poly(A) polymerase
MKITADWITHPGTQALCAVLAAAGFQALFVGGCVRNALLGVPVADVDIATDATPDRVAALCTAAGLRVVPTGLEHGTLTVIAQGIAHEVTSFRRDIATDGRRATVAFATDIAEDAARRDFTLNALYARADGTVIDPLGGLPDLLARRILFVGAAQDRIREDYLRILRFFRFHAQYGDPAQGLCPEALAAIATNLDGLDRVSRERIGQEMRKLLSAPDPAPALAAMQQTGVLAHVLPGADARALGPLVHLDAALSPDWLRRLAVLGGDDPTDALRLSRPEARDWQALRAHLSDPPALAAYRLGTDRGRDCALILAALTGQPAPADLDTQLARGANATFPVKPADLMPALTGAALGERLRHLETRWIDSGFSLSRGDLLAL